MHAQPREELGVASDVDSCERHHAALKMDERLVARALEFFAVGNGDSASRVLGLAADAERKQRPKVGRRGCVAHIGKAKRARADAQRSKQRAVARLVDACVNHAGNVAWIHPPPRTRSSPS